MTSGSAWEPVHWTIFWRCGSSARTFKSFSVWVASSVNTTIDPEWWAMYWHCSGLLVV